LPANILQPDSLTRRNLNLGDRNFDWHLSISKEFRRVGKSELLYPRDTHEAIQKTELLNCLIIVFLDKPMIIPIIWKPSFVL
jgi:hypothetical protein